MNILVVSTRQINVGDEFIWFGIRRLLREVGVDANFILFNRHPSINPRPRLYTRKPWLKSMQPTYDNSFYLDQDLPIDHVLFAGTPKWNSGVHARMLHSYILKNKIRTSFLGIGTEGGVPTISDELKTILSEFNTLTVARDPDCFKAVKAFPFAFSDVCPAIFCANEGDGKNCFKLSKLGVVLQMSGNVSQSIPLSIATTENLLSQFKMLSEKYDVEFIAHYISDLKMAVANNIPGRVHYSSFSEDFFEIYKCFDAIISLRVHGCGIAASLGIPSIHIGHDGRARTTEGFLSKIVSPEESLVTKIQELNVEEVSQALKKHRQESRRRWCNMLQSHLVPFLAKRADSILSV
jgi:hypothetical protein